MVPRIQAIDAQRRSHILLLITWNDPGAYSGKVYDYLAARRPILSIGPSRSVLEGLLDSTEAGAHVSTTEAIEAEFLKYYNEFKSTGTIRYSGIESVLDSHTHRAMAHRFAEVLSDLHRG
jgi:hypothetical protein